MKRITLAILILLSSILASEIEIKEGTNDFQIHDKGRSSQKIIAIDEAKITFGTSANLIDHYLYGDWKAYGTTSGAYSLWDESLDRFVLEGSDLKLNDNDYLLLGDATNGDVQQSWNGTYLELAPVSGFWANCPNLSYPDASGYFHYFEDFIGHVNFPATSGSGGGWKVTGDATYDVLNAAGTIGGIIQVAPEAGTNSELYLQLGELGTETYIEYVQDSGDKSWVEFRVAASSVTAAANWFVGLAEEGAAAANFIVDTGDSTSNVDMVGFVVWEADPDAIDCNHQKVDGHFVDAGLAGVPVANTYVTLGLYFDGVQTVSWYYNGTVVQTADLETATFPTGEELSPIIGMKQGAGNVTLSVDWIRIVSER